MKVLITSHQSEASGKLAYLLKGFEVIFGDLSVDFPKVDSASLAHEILKFSLDNGISRIYPTRFEDLVSLKKSQILFDEFDIKIMLTVGDELIFNNPSAEAENYTSLSSKILSLGYPNQNIALGNAKGKGDLILLDDDIKDFSNIWNQVKAVSFVQIGKLFNYPNFEKMQLYNFKNGIKKAFVLIEETQEVQFFENLDNDLQLEVKKLILNKNVKGFYEINYDEEKILRIKNTALSC